MVGVAMARSVTQRGGSDRKLDTRQARPGEKVIGTDADQQRRRDTTCLTRRTCGPL